MKKIIAIAAMAMMTSLAGAQVRSSSSSFGLNLGGVVSVFMENNSRLGLNKKQMNQIDVCRSRYENDYNNWYRKKRYSDREIQYKRNQMVQNIRIEIENILTYEQRNDWYAYDDRYNRKHYYEKRHHHHHDHDDDYYEDRIKRQEKYEKYKRKEAERARKENYKRYKKYHDD